MWFIGRALPRPYKNVNIQHGQRHDKGHHTVKLRTIFWFWVPLAFSWLLMTFEGPWIQGVISRKADPELQLAAFGLVMSLSITIEAPVIMFLAVGSALTRDRQSYRVLWWYMMAVNVLVTVVAALMAFTPLLDLYLGGLLGIPQNIIDATRPGMVIMIFWSAFIGYRRFHQGLLIRNGRTNTIGTGTIIRIVASAGVAFGLGAWSDLPGAVIGGYSLMAAVLVEMIYVHIIVKPDVEALPDKRKKPEDNLTFLKILRFHLPLAVTSLMTLLIRPVLESGIANSSEAEQGLAAFPVIFSILLVMRSGGLAWQEVVIALSTSEREVFSLRRFTWFLSLGMSGFMTIFALTPLIDVYVGTILDVPEALHPLIVAGTIFAAAVPFITAWQSYFRALLMRIDNTAPIYQGMIVGFVFTVGVLWGGLQIGLPAIPVASAALSVGIAIELLYLWRAFAAKQTELQHVWEETLVTER